MKKYIKKILGLNKSKRKGPPSIAELNKDKSDLVYLFNNNFENLNYAIETYFKEAENNTILIGKKEDCEKIIKNFLDKNLKIDFIEFDFTNKKNSKLNINNNYILYSTPSSDYEWEIYDNLLKQNYKIKTLWEVLSKNSIINTISNKFEFNEKNFEELINMYKVQKKSNETIYVFNEINKLLKTENFIKNKNLLEFGPSDGNHTSLILKNSPNKLTSIEGRPENIIKLLTAKYCFDWKNFELITNNFLSINPREYKNIDLIFALGVCYHVNAPFYFLKKLTEISNNIIISSWFANPKKIIGEKKTWKIQNKDYFGHVYKEPDHFLSGLQPYSVYLEFDSMKKYFESLNFKVSTIKYEDNRDHVTGIFAYLYIEKQ